MDKNAKMFFESGLIRGECIKNGRPDLPSVKSSSACRVWKWPSLCPVIFEFVRKQREKTRSLRRLTAQITALPPSRPPFPAQSPEHVESQGARKADIFPAGEHNEAERIGHASVLPCNAHARNDPAATRPGIDETRCGEMRLLRGGRASRSVAAMPRVPEQARASELQTGVEAGLLLKPAAKLLQCFKYGVARGDEPAAEDSQLFRRSVHGKRKIAQFKKRCVHLAAERCQSWFGFGDDLFRGAGLLGRQAGRQWEDEHVRRGGGIAGDGFIICPGGRSEKTQYKKNDQRRRPSGGRVNTNHNVPAV